MYRWEQIQADIQDEQSRVQYLDSLIGQERQTLAGLQQVFRAQDVQFADAQQLLKERAALGEQARMTEAAQIAAARSAASIPDEMAQQLSAAFASGRTANALQAALDAIKVQPGAASKILGMAVDKADRAGFKRGDIAKIEQAATNARAPRAGTGAQQALRERETAFGQALESAYFAGPTGIRGGYKGLELVNLRDLTAAGLRERAAQSPTEEAKRLGERATALEASGYATGSDAFEAALSAVRQTGDPKSIQDPYARQLYEEARQAGAYRNDQRADFEQEVLDSRARLARLSMERERIAGAYDDPAREAARRELVARGYRIEDPGSANEWRNQYLQYQQTPDYNLYLKAHELTQGAVEAGKPLAPTTPEEQVVARYTELARRKGKPIDIASLRKELGKAKIKGEQADKAIAWGMAWWELGGPEQNVEAVRQRIGYQAKEQAAREDATKSVDAELGMVREQAKAAEQRAAEPAPMPPEPPARVEAQALRAGLSPETARYAASLPPTGTRTPLLEPAPRAPMPAPVEDFKLTGQVIQVSQAEPKQKPKPAPARKPQQPTAQKTTPAQKPSKTNEEREADIFRSLGY